MAHLQVAVKALPRNHPEFEYKTVRIPPACRHDMKWQNMCGGIFCSTLAQDQECVHVWAQPTKTSGRTASSKVCGAGLCHGDEHVLPVHATRHQDAVGRILGSILLPAWYCQWDREKFQSKANDRSPVAFARSICVVSVEHIGRMCRADHLPILLSRLSNFMDHDAEENSRNQLNRSGGSGTPGRQIFLFVVFRDCRSDSLKNEC